MANTRRGIGASGYLKRFFVGRALASHKAEHQLLPKFLALPVFSSDVMSSVAYAAEASLFTLAIAVGAAAFGYLMPISILIVALLAVVTISYR